MPRIGYHASHEQFPPDALLDLVIRAKQAGFGAAMCSDHFHPWTRAQGHSGHAWTWLGREGGGAGKPLHLQVKLSFATSDGEAMAGAMEQWRANVLEGDQNQELRTPAEFEAAARDVDEAAMRAAVRISADPVRHRAWLEEDLAMGFDGLYLHNVNRQQERFVDVFGDKVLPGLG